MSITREAAENMIRLFGKEDAFGLAQTDPEYFERIANFAFDEVPNEEAAALDERTRFMAILAVLTGVQGIDLFREMVPAALNAGVTPVEIREIVYQATAYLGFGRVYPFLKAVSEILAEKGIDLPLAPQATTDAGIADLTDPANRRRAGNDVQIKYFGEGIRNGWEKGPQEKRHISAWLADNCFGDYYTRNGLTDPQREMITFCFIAGQGGCEPQLTAHAKGNMNLGNDRLFLIKVVSQCVPYIGYPRSLNAIACIEKAAEG